MQQEEENVRFRRRYYYRNMIGRKVKMNRERETKREERKRK
jgi:hypothetical protein